MRNTGSGFGGFLFWNLTGFLLGIFLFAVLIFTGPVSIPFKDVAGILAGKEVGLSFWPTIIFENRLPMAILAATSGAILSVAGLMMQTVFTNPLAGPSVLGVSSGASLGVATLMLCGGSLIPSLVLNSLVSITGALAGAIVIVFVLLAFSSILRNGVMLLIVGLMITYLCSSLISLLNFFSPADEIRSYLIWGLGSFMGQRLVPSLWYCGLSCALLLFSFLMIKPLNALLPGERYAESVGYNIQKTRSLILMVAGVLVALSTAFCGPIAFIGLIVPHLCRLLLRTSNHMFLIPSCIIFGATLTLLCAYFTVLPASEFGILPINVITPIIGVPVILYILVFRKRIAYL